MTLPWNLPNFKKYYFIAFQMFSLGFLHPFVGYLFTKPRPTSVYSGMSNIDSIFIGTQSQCL